MANDDRRTLLKVLTGVLGGGAAAAVGLPALRALVDPVDRTTVTGAGEFVPIAAVTAIPTDGTPLKVPVVIQNPRDAWTKLPPTEMGAVYVRKTDEGLVAYSTVCPHLGCGVDYVADKSAFACPCHESAFDLEGRVAGGPSPRPLDRLETRISGEQLEVRFQQFKQGTKEKIPT
jgi:Rieske Fe-S protein